MTHISAEVAGWAALILSQVYLLKYRLFGQHIDKIGAALCITMQSCCVSAAPSQTLLHREVNAMTTPIAITAKLSRAGTAVREVPAEDPNRRMRGVSRHGRRKPESLSGARFLSVRARLAQEKRT